MKKVNPDFVGTALALVSGVCFGTMAIFATFSYQEGIERTTLLTMRFLLAGSLLIGFQYLRNGLNLNSRQVLKCLAMGSIGYAAQSWLFFSAVERTGAGLSAILLYLYPSFVVGTSWFAFKEKIGTVKFLSVFLALAGCILICYSPMVQLDWLGICFGIGAAVVYAIYLMVSQIWLSGINPLTSSGVISLGAGATFLVFSYFHDGVVVPTTAVGWGTILALVIVCTIVPMTTMFAAIDRIGVSRASLLCTIEPAVTVLLGILFLGEVMTFRQGLGTLLILTSLGIIQIRNKTN
jgi:drug/metabolite transporter (DMT)-like permease